jgi:hypothetical protein
MLIFRSLKNKIEDEIIDIYKLVSSTNLVVPKKCIGSLRSICSYFVYVDSHRQHSKPRFTVLSMVDSDEVVPSVC